MRKLINLVIAKISQVSRNDKEKDILSLVYITWFVLCFFLILIPLIIEFLAAIFRKILGVNFDTLSSKEILLNIFDLSVFNIDDILKLFLVGLIPIISRIFLKKSNFKTELLVMVVSILGIVIIYNNYILSLIIFLSVILIICVVPLGKGKYINFVINIKYLKEVGENYLHKNKEVLNKEIYKKVVFRCVKISVIIVLIASLLSYYMSMSFIFMLIIVISLGCLLYLYRETKDEIMTVCKKIIIFIVFLFISLYANRGILNNIEKILLSLITIYFSFDRIISLGKDIKDIIKKYSITYYIENEYLTIKDIKNEYIDMKFIVSYEIEEYELVKQIILRQRLFLITELEELCSLYIEKEYKYYRQLVEFNLYITNINFKKNNLNDEEREFEKMINIENQKIYPIELYKEYANILYARGKYNEALKIYEQLIVYLNINELNMICECYSKLGKNKMANHIQKNYIDLRN